jgi:hypothetical protein
MRDNLQCLRNGAVKRCAICNRNFSLIRHYSWRTALCSKKCVDRFKARQGGDRRWMHWRDLCYRFDRVRSLVEGSGPGEP